MLAKKLDRAKVERRLCDPGRELLADERLRKLAEHNWYVLFGTQLPECK